MSSSSNLQTQSMFRISLVNSIIIGTLHFSRNDEGNCFTDIGENCKYLSAIVEDIKKEKKDRIFKDVKIIIHPTDKDDQQVTKIKDAQYRNASEYIDIIANDPFCEVVKEHRYSNE